VSGAGIAWIVAALVVGGALGLYLARSVQMTQMPELVAFMHSLVGLVAVVVGYASYIDPTAVAGMSAGEIGIHHVEVYLGVFIGAVTLAGSVIAFGKLSGRIGGKPLILPARHWLNLALLIAIIALGAVFLNAPSIDNGLKPLVVMTVLALLFGVHLVMAIGGADMPVVVSMLNSYSGWAAAATGFMLSNDLLIVTGALVGSSGAILSYIMCKAMNRNFLRLHKARRSPSAPRKLLTCSKKPRASSSYPVTAWRLHRRSTRSMKSRSIYARRARTFDSRFIRWRDVCRDI
jgi:NAD(P) transhydrogenase subunit beta